MEASLQELKASPRMVPRAVYLPNCDRKGFYKRKQVGHPHTSLAPSFPNQHLQGNLHLQEWLTFLLPVT